MDMAVLDAANGLETNIEIILQRRRARNKGSSLIESVPFFATDTSSQPGSLQSLAQSVSSNAEAAAALHPSQDTLNLSSMHLDKYLDLQSPMNPVPTLVALHRRAREPHQGPNSKAPTPAVTSGPALASSQAGTHASRAQQVAQHPSSTKMTLGDSHFVLDAALGALGSASQLLSRGMTMLCHIQPIPLNGAGAALFDRHGGLPAFRNQRHSPLFLFLGGGSTALHGFWKEFSRESDEASSDAFHMLLTDIDRIHISAFESERHFVLLAPPISISLVSPDMQARSDWISSLLLLRSVQPAGLQ
jgi:hypothetical protein